MLGVNNNIGNLRAQDAMSFNHAKLQVALERLSTGVRVNRAEDDASGLILRDRFQAQMGGLEEGIRNIQTAQGMIQVAEEGINKITDSLQQMRQLAVRAADDNLNDKDRSDVQVQITMLLKEVNDRSEKTKYNGHNLLNGSITEAVEERRSTAEIQTNAFLRDGTSLMEIDLEDAANATTFGAVSQGTYEVKLVFNDTSATGQVDAVIYWTDGGAAPTIAATLAAVDGVNGGQSSIALGGSLITVNTVSRYDTGLVAYAKTLTYVSATTEDNALQFQTGSDEGEVFRVGIQKMTVEAIFRRDFYMGESGDPGFSDPYDVAAGGSLSLATTLQAQDLIGQIDDALRIVGRANLKVGAFKNEFDRTLDQQRSNHTQITNAYANVNDADMAVEATAQSKRNILIQSGTAMIAQANTSSQFVLQLLR